MNRLLTVTACAIMALGGLAAPATAAGVDSDPSLRIIGGKPSTQPYSFMISYGMAGMHECAGMLIAPQWILTAAHCDESYWAPSTTARIGSLEWKGGEAIKMMRPTTHPGWDAKKMVGVDLAVAKLERPATSRTIKIASEAGPVGTQTLIMGWGRTITNSSSRPAVLQELTTSITEPKRCDGQALPFLHGKEICTDNPGGKTGACVGDSGGPQIKRVGTEWQLIGVTSRGPDPDKEGCGSAPSIYTDATVYRDWIAKTTGVNLP